MFTKEFLTSKLTTFLPETFVKEVDDVVWGCTSDEGSEAPHHPLLSFQVQDESRDTLISTSRGAGRCQRKLGHRHPSWVARNQPSQRTLAYLRGILPLRLVVVGRVLHLDSAAIPDHDAASHPSRDNVLDHGGSPWVGQGGLVDFLESVEEVATREYSIEKNREI